MSGKINVDYKVLKKQISEISSAKEEFKPYINNFIVSSKDSLRPMNSDFCSALSKALNAMEDDVKSNLIKNIENYEKALKLTLDEFTDYSIKATNSIKGGF